MSTTSVKEGNFAEHTDVIRAVVDMKQRNPTWGCPRIAKQIALAFGIPMNKHVVRRILALHYGLAPDGGGPSWLTFSGHMKDSLWSVDLFRCESVALRNNVAVYTKTNGCMSTNSPSTCPEIGRKGAALR